MAKSVSGTQRKGKAPQATGVRRGRPASAVRTGAARANAAAAPEAAVGVAAVNRALQILLAFDGESDGLPLTEISNRTGLYKSTVLRLSESFETYGFLHRGDDGLFRLGHELIRLGELAKRMRHTSDYILSALRRLTEQTDESSTYYVRQGNSRLALFRVDTQRSIRDSIRAGDRMPLDRGAAGHVLQRADQPAPTRLKERFEPTISLGERDPELAAIAAPVYVGDVLEGAITISGPRTRFTDARLKALSKILSEACAELSKRIS
ncbi:IclR family transcriptional regulator [Ferrovibrio sp.]|uniref:IclR family transcriptional regulator n=1 Tax=Ferrovibrio sp. TaxID=1917215 RepID=UPI0035B22BAD